MPSANQVHVDKALSDFASRYSNGDYHADKLSPPVPVDNRSDKYFTYSRRDVTKRVDDRLSVQGHANEVGYTQGQQNYSVEDRGLNGVVPTEVERNADAPLSPEEDETDVVMEALMREREIRVATLLTTAANFASGNSTTLTNAWTDRTNGVPVDDFNTGLAVLPPIANSRTLAIMSRPVWNALRTHPQLTGLRAGGGTVAGQVSRAEAAAALEVDEILVSDSWYDSANEGQAISLSRIWDATKAVIVRVPQRPRGNRIHAFSVSFRCKPGITVRRWFDPNRGKGGSTIIRVEFSDDEVIVQNDAAYLMQNAAA